MKSKKLVISLLVLFLIIVAVAMFFNYPGNLIGYTVFEGNGTNVISHSGYWELSQDIESNSPTAISINSSDVILDCKDKIITINAEQNISEETFGIVVSADLANVTIQNCEINNVDNGILINTGSIADIISTLVEAENCIEGDWNDLSGNMGCLDIVGPEINVTNQTLYTNESFSYQVQAEDVSGIAGYSVLILTPAASSTILSISNNGLIVNTTGFAVADYVIQVNATDNENQSSTVLLGLQVLQGTVSQDTTDDDDDDDSDDSSAADSDSSGSEEPAEVLEDCEAGVEAWTCSEWSECIEGAKRRTCEKTRDDCYQPLPSTKEECDCVEDWSCTWSECADGVKTASECSDLNNCGTETNKPTTEECSEEEMKQSGATGLAILDTAKAATGKLVDVISSTIFRIFALIVILVAVVVLFVMKPRMKSISGQGIKVSSTTARKQTAPVKSKFAFFSSMKNNFKNFFAKKSNGFNAKNVTPKSRF